MKHKDRVFLNFKQWKVMLRNKHVRKLKDWEMTMVWSFIQVSSIDSEKMRGLWNITQLNTCPNKMVWQNAWIGYSLRGLIVCSLMLDLEMNFELRRFLQLAIKWTGIHRLSLSVRRLRRNGSMLLQFAVGWWSLVVLLTLMLIKVSSNFELRSVFF